MLGMDDGLASSGSINDHRKYALQGNISEEKVEVGDLANSRLGSFLSHGPVSTTNTSRGFLSWLCWASSSPRRACRRQYLWGIATYGPLDSARTAIYTTTLLHAWSSSFGPFNPFVPLTRCALEATTVQHGRYPLYKCGHQD